MPPKAAKTKKGGDKSPPPEKSEPTTPKGPAPAKEFPINTEVEERKKAEDEARKKQEDEARIAAENGNYSLANRIQKD